MKEFFTNLLQNLHVLTGVDMLTILTDEEIELLIHELIATGQQDPYHHITDGVKQRIIMENIYTDESLVRPPYGVRPGLNRRLLTRWYRAHWDVHGNKIKQDQETNPTEDAYEKYVQWAQLEGVPVLSREEALRLPTTERIDYYRQKMAKALTVGSV